MALTQPAKTLPALKKQAKRLGLRTTVTIRGKRMPKSITVLRGQISRKLRRSGNKTHRTQRRNMVSASETRQLEKIAKVVELSLVETARILENEGIRGRIMIDMVLEGVRENPSRWKNAGKDERKKMLKQTAQEAQDVAEMMASTGFGGLIIGSDDEDDEDDDDDEDLDGGMFFDD